MVDDGTDKREGGFEPDVSIFVKTVFLTCCVEEIEEEGPLVVVLHPDHLLGDVF